MKKKIHSTYIQFNDRFLFFFFFFRFSPAFFSPVLPYKRIKRNPLWKNTAILFFQRDVFIHVNA